MKYYSSKNLNGLSIEQAREKVIAALQTEGFGVLTEINIQATMKKKLNKDYLPHIILGACNPVMADKVLQVEPNISTMLPCNVTLRQLESGSIEVSAIDPVAAMSAVDNDKVAPVAAEVQQKLKRVLEAL
ncbi:MAG: DUF302 domain-containing protein [Cyclobacteriaceae bacterium]|jgi:uncharacterized protein (DUF302 family)|nr:DUF302 domain-containing protein [Cyclobacteriaceae bacterium]